jgi:hypothetical protein
MPAIALLLLLLAALSAHAAVYKCSNARGGVVYQDTACEPGHELRNLDSDPATLSVVPGTPMPPRAKLSPASAPKNARVQPSPAKNKGGNPAERKFIQAGMSEAEVVFKVGRPDVEMKGRGKEGRQWSYMPTAGDADTLTTVTFAGGKVSRVERKVVR